MGILDSVLAYKRQKDAEARADIDSIPAGIAAFTQAKQTAQKNMIDELTLKVSAAKSGLDLDTRTGQIKPNESLLDSMSRNVRAFNPLTGELEVVGQMKKGDVVRNTTRPEDIKAKEEATYEGKRETSTRAFDLRKEFQSTPEVKNYMDVRALADIANQSYKEWKAGNTKSANAIDQAIVGALGRGLDPGVSVREAEYERTPQNMSLINKFDSGLEKLKNGGVMNDQEREGAVFVLNLISDQRGKLYNEAYDYYSNTAKDLGVDTKLVTGRFKKHESVNSKKESGGLTKEALTKMTREQKIALLQSRKK